MDTPPFESPAAAVLARLGDALRTTADSAERANAIACVLRDRDTMLALARWSADEPDAYTAAILELGGIRGAGARVGQLRAAIDRAAAGLPPRSDNRPPDGGFDEVVDESVPLGDEALGALEVPPGWVLDARGVWYERVADGETSLRRATATPIGVVEVLESLRDGTERVRLRWRRGSGVWTDGIFPRSVVRDVRKVMALADLGVDVSSTTSKQVVGWLSAVEAANERSLVRSSITDRMGWQGGDSPSTLGALGFLAGNQHVPPAGRGGAPRRCVLDVDGGRSQIAASMAPAGTLDGWRQAVAKVLPYPSVLLALYASLAAPFLGILPDAPSGILDWSGSTSKGKTTTLALAASVWGHPRKGQHYVHSWDATAAYIEGAADCLRHLPLCLDDTRDSRDPLALERLIYTYAGESGRGRAKPDGLRASLEVRGVLLSTGEQPITSFGSGGGARARSLCLRGWPLGDDGHRVSIEVVSALVDHHALAGPAVVRWLLDHRDLWPKVREAWRTARDGFAATATSNVGQRLAALLALLDAGAFAAHEILGVPRPPDDPMRFAVSAADRQAEEADRPAIAIQAVYGWSCAHAADFWGREVRDKSTCEARQPAAGWAGRWMPGRWSEIAFLPGCLERVLKFEGFRPEEILSAWDERGWLVRDGKHRGKKRAVGERGEVPRCIVIPRQVIEANVGPLAEGDEGARDEGARDEGSADPSDLGGDE